MNEYLWIYKVEISPAVETDEEGNEVEKYYITPNNEYKVLTDEYIYILGSSMSAIDSQINQEFIKTIEVLGEGVVCR